MKQVFLFVSAIVFSVAAFAAKTSISTTNSFTFSPADVTINQGDTIIFDVGGIHTATEVSQNTWITNGITPSGSFNFGAGVHELTGLTPGIHYYVCQNHVSSMGMKGTITVNAVSGVRTKTTDDLLIQIFPNPAKDYIFFDTKEDIKKIVITSIDGKISKEINVGKNTNRVLISDLPDNAYIFSAYTKKDEVFTKEFVKGGQ